MRYTIFPLIILLASAIWSCSTAKHIPVDNLHKSIRRDTVYVRDSVYVSDNTKRNDSIVTKDSIVFVVDESGNVLRKELYSQKEVYRNLQREYQTLQEQYERLKSEKVDTIYQDRPIYIEKQLSLWQQFRMDVGGWAIGILVILIIAGSCWLIVKFRK